MGQMKLQQDKEKGKREEDKLFGGGRVETRGWFIEEEEIGIVQHLHSNAQSSRFSTTDSSFHPVSDLVVCCVRQRQSLDQIINLFMIPLSISLPFDR